MSCAKHNNKMKGCQDCFASELIALAMRVQRDATAIPSKMQIHLLRKEYSDLASKEKADEFVALCASLLCTINIAILANKGAAVAWEDVPVAVVGPVTQPERDAYQARLKRMGTWIGYTEFTVIARCFDLCFGIMVRVNDHWERMDIGTGNPGLGGPAGGNGRALRFGGNHYEVATFTHTGNGRYNEQVGTVVQTNGLGDCGLESFLLLLALESPPRNYTLPDQGRINQIRGTFQSVANAVARPVDATSGDYGEAIKMLRALIAYRMSQDEASHAVLAEGRPDAGSDAPSRPLTKLVPTGAKSQVWGEYVEHVGKFFALGQSLVAQSTEGNTLAVVTNIAQISAESLLKKSGNAVSSVLALSKKVENRHYREADVLDGNRKRKANLTHIGLMVAKVELKDGKTSHLISVIANFAAGRKDEESPYMVTGSSLAAKSVSLPKTSKSGSQQELFTALDMHTECYSFFMLDRWIQQRLGTDNVAAIELAFVLQLDMCHRCQAARDLFSANYGVKDTSVESAQSNDKMESELVDDALRALRRAQPGKWNPFAEQEEKHTGT